MSTTSDPPRRPARASTSWWWALLVWAVCTGLTVGALRLLLPWDQTAVPGSMPTMQLSRLRPWASWTAVALVPATWIVAGVWVRRLTRRTAVIVASTITLLVLIGFTAGPWFAWNRFTTWREADRARTRDGTTQVVFERVSMDHEIALGSVVRHGWVTERVELVDHGEAGPGDAGHLLIPRDADVPERRVFLVPDDDGGIAAVWHEPGYATGALVALGPDGTPRVVDPFLLFDEDDVGHDAAVGAWLAWFGKRTSLGREPRDDDLRAALDHPSAWVRSAAADIIRAGGPTRFPDATRALEAAR